jgi:hypothetical protein
MAVVRYPLIREDQYNAFRQIVPELPEKYEKWEYDLLSKKNKDRLEYTIPPDGSYRDIDVEINYGPFVDYCKKNNERPTKDMLYRFASEQRD